MDEAARRRVTRVLGQVEANVASRDRDEPRKAGLELVLPFLAEPEPLVPLNRLCSIRYTENRDNLFVHARSLGHGENDAYGLSMRLLGPASEDEVISSFLRAEIDSDRYGEKLRRLLARDGRQSSVLHHPNYASESENRYRRQLLDEHRAYERREEMFGGFPREIDWFRAGLGPEEVLDILYINWDWWLTLSGGSRSPRDAALRIRDGRCPGATADGHESVARALRAGSTPELIAVTTPVHAHVVVVEGHVRLTAYALFPQYLPPETEILLGVSEEITRWWAY